MKLISNNKTTSYNYFLSNNIEAGMSLQSLEVKSIISNGISLKESYVRIINDEVFLINSNINKPLTSSWESFDEKRPRKLLLHKKQTNKLSKLLKDPGTTLIATKVYIADNGKIKCEIALGKGKNVRDKRNTIKERDLKRSINREYK